MVEFFNKKEEMLEVQLTEYGKHLLSVGKLKPTYYGFYDDEILYNTQYVSTASDGTRLSESQNTIDRRIRYETPNLKVTPTRTGAETRAARFLNNVSSSIAAMNSDPVDAALDHMQQYFTEKINFSSYPIGTAAMTSENTAAWSVQFFKNTLSSSAEYILTNPSSSYADLDNGVITRIPQLDITINYQTFFQAETQGKIPEFAISDDLDGNGLYLSVYEDYLVLSIREENTVSVRENFDVEVFHVPAKLSKWLAGDPSAAQPTGSQPSSVLQPMSFIKTDGDVIANPRPLENGSGDVEYYFNIYLDDEIPFDILTETGINPRAVGNAANRLALNRDLYRTPDEEPC